MKPTLLSAFALLLATLPAPAQQEVLRMEGPTFSTFGSSLAAIGDLNGDAIPEIVTGAPQDGTGGFLRGAARLHDGATGTVLRTWTGSRDGDGLGTAVAAAGDIDGDGLPDLLLGAPGDDTNGAQAGAVWVVNGATGAVIRIHFGSTAGDAMGRAIAGPGDVDGDGCDDVLAGAPNNDSQGPDRGCVMVWSGRDGSVLHTFFGSRDGETLGFSVAAAGDVDADGCADLAAGTPNGVNAFFQGTGLVRIFSGLTGAELRTCEGNPGSQFGYAMAGGQDADGDTFLDLLVGARTDSLNGMVANGSCTLISGATGATLMQVAGPVDGSSFGRAVGFAGDADGDGHGDFLVGAPFIFWNGGTENGAAFLHSGDDGALLTTISGNDFDQAGAAMDCAGDRDGDGASEWMVGIPMDDTSGVNAGSVTVWRLENFLLAPPTPGVAGMVNTMEATGLAPGDLAVLAYGTTGGSTPVPGCPGLTVAIANAQQGPTAVADPSGTATFSAMVPASAAGRQFCLQAVDPTGCRISNMVIHTF